MTTSELLLQDFDFEAANTRKLLELIPGDKPTWKPHEKSMEIGKLAMHSATLPLFGKYIMELPELNLANSPVPHADLTFTTTATLLERQTDSAAQCRSALATSSDEDLAKVWKFSFGEQLISNDIRSLTFRKMCFNHMIHHRAQLTVYLRLLNIPIPGLYGPSADQPWAA